RANTTAMTDLVSNAACGKMSSAVRMPRLAESIVPAVVGDTNLLRLSACMIRPATDKPAPAMRMATSRGIRLTRNTWRWSSDIWNKSSGVIDFAPMNNEATDRMTSAASKNRSFNDLPPDAINENDYQRCHPYTM